MNDESGELMEEVLLLRLGELTLIVFGLRMPSSYFTCHIVADT